MKKKKAPCYSIVIPCFNSSNSLEGLVQRIDTVFSKKIKKSYEIIFVDDASPLPETWNTLDTLAKTYPHVVAIRLMRNFSQPCAILCGISHSKGKYIITMDDDGQHRPEDIPALIAKEQHDIVIGYFEKKKHVFFKKCASAFTSYLTHIILKKPRGISLSSFRLFNRKVAEAILHIHTPYPYMEALLFYVSRDVVNVMVTHGERGNGKSNYSLHRMVKLFSNLLINNSCLVLRGVGYSGLTIASISLLFSVYLIMRKLMGVQAEGWTSIMVTLLFFGGSILFTLGVIGEYLHRIIVGVEQKPVYVVRHVITGE